MPDVDADRNLLFGLLALQNHFIDRDGLLDAFGRWVNDRAVPLGQILCDCDALKPDEYDLLQAVITKHLEKFGGDAEKSLQHLSSIGSVREELSRITDADLQDRLAHVSAARTDDDPYRTVSQVSVGESSARGESTSIGTRFRILRPHAKGGLGQVSVALDQELNRPVALKEIQDRYADEPLSRARFVQEAEITGKLEHPGIIPVYGLGHDPSGRPFYAMRFIQGDSLKEAIAAFRGDEGLKQSPVARMARLRELLRRFTDVCNAVAYAHSRGVLHRDLKPGNIMLGPYGETLVVDWGLAKSVGDVLSSEAASGGDSSLGEGPIRLSGQSGSRAETVAGSPMGTPAYASPEQVSGALDRLGPATDIYGMGATLYALLTGRSPVESNDLGEVIRRVERGEILPPRSIDQTIPEPLEAICRKAMATNPGDRYDSAQALATDVTKWLDDEPVTAYPEPVSVRAARWMRRHRTAMLGSAIAGLVGLIGLVAVAAVQTRSNQALQAANEKTFRALVAETKAKEGTQEALTQKGEALAQSEEARKRAEGVLGFLKDDVLAAARPEGLDGGLGVDVSVRKAIDAAEPKIAEAFKDHPIVEADVRDTLGTTYWYLREATLAIRQYERALELHQAQLGPDHPDTLRSRNNLATAYRDAGRTDDAIKLLEVTLKQRELKLGPDDFATLTSRDNLATAYRDAGRTDDAIKLYEATLKQWESKLGPDHPDTLISQGSLAMAYRDAGRTNDAIKLHEANIKHWESKLGPDHRNTLVSRHNLAGAYVDAGRTDDAITLYKATLQHQESTLGPDHPDTLTSQGNLAKAYLAASQLDRAISLVEHALQGLRAKLGPDHPRTLTTEQFLADAYASAGMHTRAEALVRGCLERARKRFGSADRNVVQAMASLGLNLIQQRKWTEAEPILRECLAIREKAQPDDWRSFNVRSQLGGSVLGQMRFADAEPLILAGYEGMKAREAKIPSPNKPRLSEAAERIVQLYEAWGKTDKVAEWRAKLAREGRK